MHRFGRIVWAPGAGWLAGCVLLAGLGGCFSDDQPRIAPELVDSVQVTRVEPGPSCQTLGAVEGRSSDDDDSYPSAYEAVRERAALRGGNYVVIDAISGPMMAPGGIYDAAITIRGRLYGCAVGLPWASARVPAPQAYVAQAPECGAQ